MLMQSFFVFRPLGPPSMFYCCNSKELKRYLHIWKLSNNTALLTLKIFLTALIFECYGEMKFLNLTNLKNKEQLLYLYNKNKKKQRTVIIFIVTETCNFKHFFSRKVVGLKQFLLLTTKLLIQNVISVLSEFMFLFMTYPFSICQFTKLWNGTWMWIVICILKMK